MDAVHFAEENVIYAEKQEEYISLPSFRKENGDAIFCFKLNEEELEQIKETGKIYLTICTFNQPLQPIGSTLLNPFKK